MGEAERQFVWLQGGWEGTAGLCRPSGLLGASSWLPAASEEFPEGGQRVAGCTLSEQSTQQGKALSQQPGLQNPQRLNTP